MKSLPSTISRLAFSVNPLCLIFTSSALEVNDRPSKSYHFILTVKDDSIIAVNKVPTFITTPVNLDKDQNIEVAGFWDYSQTWGPDNSLTAYNPILYYEITNDGLLLDSSLTIKRNTIIYGEFKGYNFSVKIEMPVSTLDKMGDEIKRIEGTE